MRCPNPDCNSYYHKVLDTESRIDSLTKRVCTCPKCGLVFETAEYYVGSERARKIYQEHILPGVLALEKEWRDRGY